MASIIDKVFFCQFSLAEVSDKLFALQMSSSLLHRQSLPLRSLEDHPMVTLVRVPVNKKL